MLNVIEVKKLTHFFKWLPCFILPVLKKASKLTIYSALLGRILKLLPFNTTTTKPDTLINSDIESSGQSFTDKEIEIFREIITRGYGFMNVLGKSSK